MSQAYSSISSSKPNRSIARSTAWVLAGLVATLVCFELTTDTLFSMPDDAREPSGAMQRYFSYGYSIESKLHRTVGKEGQEPTAIVRAGWIPTELYDPPEDWDDAPKALTIYGMSFTNRIARALNGIAPDFAVSTRAGPGAPFSHSYAMFEVDPWKSEADIVVVGILSSSIQRMSSLNGLGYSPESPAPFSYPKFELLEGELIRQDPVISDRDTFVDSFRLQNDVWKKHIASLQSNDAYWNSFIYNHSISDRSALIRLIRRARASSFIDSVGSKLYHPERGYPLEHPVIAAIPVMLENMQRACKENEQRFVVLLLHAKGEPGHLNQWLSEDLRSMGISVISTTDLFSSLDAMNFEGDGHYTPQRDREIAQALHQLILETH